MKRIVIRYGILMFLGFTGFFVLMHLFGLSQRFDLRVFNGIIHLTFITLAVREYLSTRTDESNYMNGVGVGIVTSMIGVIPFAIFQLIHLAVNTPFMTYLQENVPYVGQYLTPFTAALSILVEGIAVSIIGSYIVTRIVHSMMYKPEEHHAHENARVRRLHRMHPEHLN